MLDTDTRRRIDAARDILVGKVPDPKSQVEQITIALIYKFMDDMDAQAEQFGGRRTFFAGEFAPYAWPKLMSQELGGADRVKLYEDGVNAVQRNTGIADLFRKMTKDFRLPYTNPETLKLFLKQIDGFTYDHSERLGDAFEYLLSVLGSQGDAGQFRTPRHIIDFIVKVVDPKKTDVILDPACGTAGFLISAYKHILAQNVDANGKPTLTPDERKRLADNVHGYDISPDMVRLSLVNLYLHGFADPHVTEYDALTSQERWSEVADVILANPPFMSPKGGIKPHDRFGVKSKRSEVLFVDYMAEHLTPTGRAGIIVPEGIIFQSQTAYVRLRKTLVEQYLVAVVSLPAGIFQPYSGVKTSILVLDKAAAKNADTVGFFKVEADGFGLGAQRRAIAKNDLPQVASEVAQYLKRLRNRDSVKDFSPTFGLVVPKQKVAANADYNLSGERYREGGPRPHIYPPAPLAEICAINPPKSEVLSLPPDTVVSFVPMADLGENRLAFVPLETKTVAEVGSSYTYFKDNDVLVAKVTPCFENGKAGIARNLTNGIGFGSSEFFVLRSSDRVLPEFVYFCVTSEVFRDGAIEQMTGTGGLQRVPRGYVERFEIPLPPLSVQAEIVAEIHGYQKVIDGARAVLDHYRPHIPIQAEWSAVRVDSVGTVQGGVQKSPDRQPVRDHRPYLTVRNVQRGYLDLTQVERFEVTKVELERLRLCTGDILVVEGNGSREHIGRNALFELNGEEWVHQNHVIRIRLDQTQAIPRFVSFYLNSPPGHEQMLARAATTSGLFMLSVGKVQSLSIPLPPLSEQQRIVAEIEAEQRLVAGNRELVERFERKIQQTLARVWGDAPAATDEPPASIKPDEFVLG